MLLLLILVDEICDVDQQLSSFPSDFNRGVSLQELFVEHLFSIERNSPVEHFRANANCIGTGGPPLVCGGINVLFRNGYDV